MKNYLKKWLDDLQIRLQNHRSWNDVPFALKKYVYKWLGLSTITLIALSSINLPIDFIKVKILFFFIILLLFLYTMYVCFLLCFNDIKSITGICVKIERVMVNKINVYIKTTDEKMYVFMISDVYRKKPLFIGDTVTIYPVDANSVYENGNVNVIMQYYTTDIMKTV